MGAYFAKIWVQLTMSPTYVIYVGGKLDLRQFTFFASVEKSICVKLRNLHKHKWRILRELNDLRKLEALCDVV